MASLGGPNIVTSGLVLSLDAANIKSYPGSGTTWRDLSGNSNNGTLTNGPTFSSANGGSIVFDGVNDFVGCGNATNLQITVGSISAWVRTSTPGNDFRGIITKQNTWGLFVSSSVLVTFDWGNSQTRSTAINIADGTWKNVAMTFTQTTGNPSNNAIIYINGNSVLTTTVRNLDQTIQVEIARGGSGSGGIGQLLNGSIANTQIYNRTLSADEVLQNYNATQARFNL